MLHYENMDVYQRAIELLALAVKLCQRMPRGYSPLSDQLKRAAWSIPLNIAEAAGKSTKLDSSRFFAVARGSAMECGAVLDVCEVLHIGDPQLLKDSKALIIRIVSMLTKLIKF